MANSDKNILITPHVGGVTQPNIVFTGQGNDPITLRVLDGATGTGLTSGGALSFEGSAGQLFSIVNRLGTGSIFSVNDISGIPSIDVDASGRIVFAGFTGNVGIGTSNPVQKLDIVGNIQVSGNEVTTLSGDLEINPGGNIMTVPKEMGLICFFPSFLLHRVTPLTSGNRITLVTWLCGANLR